MLSPSERTRLNKYAAQLLKDTTLTLDAKCALHYNACIRSLRLA